MSIARDTNWFPGVQDIVSFVIRTIDSLVFVITIGVALKIVFMDPVIMSETNTMFNILVTTS